MMQQVLSHFGFKEGSYNIQPFGNGLINKTWVVEIKLSARTYILQRINETVFKHPADIAFNISLMGDWLSKTFPNYLFTKPINKINGHPLLKTEFGYFRMYPFVENSHSIDVVANEGQAFEAAKQFGRFTKNLSGLTVTQLKITLPDFHNLSLRYQQFEMAMQNGNEKRIKESKEWIEFIVKHKNIVTTFEELTKELKLRCTHHDTKISNVLFDKTGKGLCVIDLDTVMPGYFISDVGDMMRTYLSPVSEEEKDYSKIEIRSAFYHAIVNGYLSEMGEELSELEKKQFYFAGKCMIYMQAIRFLTDHLNNDLYYGAQYEGHNLIRAGNQISLLKCLMEFNPE